jgi:hypothetical protein
LTCPNSWILFSVIWDNRATAFLKSPLISTWNNMVFCHHQLYNTAVTKIYGWSTK